MNELKPQSASAPGACSVVAHCVCCKEPLTRPAGKKWWIAGSQHDEGLCYGCILAGMRVLMAGVEYAQDHGQEIAELPPNEQALPRRPRGRAERRTTMNLCEMTPGPRDEAGRRWQQRLVRRIRRTVRRERAMGMDDTDVCQHHLARRRPEDAITILAELAGVDWLYDPNTGEVRFFEFN